MTLCPDCGAPMALPDSPRPVESCNCGWYLVGALTDDAIEVPVDETPAPNVPGGLPPGLDT